MSDLEKRVEELRKSAQPCHEDCSNSRDSDDPCSDCRESIWEAAYDAMKAERDEAVSSDVESIEMYHRARQRANSLRDQLDAFRLLFDGRAVSVLVNGEPTITVGAAGAYLVALEGEKDEAREQLRLANVDAFTAEAKRDAALERAREAEAEVVRQHGPLRRGGGSIVVECWDEQRGLIPGACPICRRVLGGEE